MKISEQLVAAKQLLQTKGWCKHLLWSHQGEHCALGAVLAARIGIEALRLGRKSDSEWDFQIPVIETLRDAIPKGDVPHCMYSHVLSPQDLAWAQVAAYNNSRESFTEIETWFDRATEMAQAKEMWAELESSPAQTEVQPLKEGDVLCLLK